MRWSRRLAVVAALVVAAGALSWYVVIPNWRPPLQAGEQYGLDVSRHQGEIDWPAVAGDGISFAYIKASEGGDWTDEKFATNWAEAQAAGIRTGAYHFFTLCRDGDDQARQFLRVAPPDPDALPPALDLEFGGNCRERPPNDELHGEVEEFIEIVEDAWSKPVVLYVWHDFERKYEVRETYGRPLWIRSYPQRPRSEWSVWQLHGYANVEGVDGGVDLNVARIEDIT